MKKVIAFGSLFAPALASAAITDVNSIFTFLLSLLNSATVLIMAVAVVYTLWGIFGFIKAGGDVAGKDDNRKKIISGIIGLAVMGSVYGLVNVLTTTLGLTGTQITPPALPSLTK